MLSPNGIKWGTRLKNSRQRHLSQNTEKEESGEKVQEDNNANTEVTMPPEKEEVVTQHLNQRIRQLRHLSQQLHQLRCLK